eukprot:2516635-Prymnesium_polylepis.1
MMLKRHDALQLVGRKLAGGALRRLLEARLTYSSPKVCARRSCTNPRCPPNYGHRTCIASALV